MEKKMEAIPAEELKKRFREEDAAVNTVLQGAILTALTEVRNLIECNPDESRRHRSGLG